MSDDYEALVEEHAEFDRYLTAIAQRFERCNFGFITAHVDALFKERDAWQAEALRCRNVIYSVCRKKAALELEMQTKLNAANAEIERLEEDLKDERNDFAELEGAYLKLLEERPCPEP